MFKSRFFVVLCCAAVCGITITVVLIQREGMRGLWQRKRSFLEKVHPGLKPLMDKAESEAPGLKE